jgi:D-alanyl-D-alanine carboxypeptidase
MNDKNQPPLISNETSIIVRRGFPIIPQLLILGSFVFVLFAGYLGSLLTTPASMPTQPASTPDAIPLNSVPLAPLRINDVSIQAEAAFVLDVQTGQTLYEQNADAVLPLASITKLMTSLLAHELMADDTEVVVPLSAVEQEGSSGLKVGERFATHELGELALIASSNDAAHTLGARVGALLGDTDATAQFVAGMNIRAQELGLETLRFNNPTGLDISAREAGGYGSARDVSLLLAYILTTYPEIIAPTKEEATRVYNSDGEYHTAVNTNDVLSRIPNVLASKTGFTDLAGGNLTIAFDVSFNRPVIVTVLGSTRSERFTDTLTLVTATKAAIADYESPITP